ncbi:UPF0606 protein KIAA1549 homolog [Pelobates fuscus]|uniref:UPF0606 protein KIAA1549 homolog n=1 Tax=Pelobates fuscus TaxID=191477 RepID=UPI002FE4B6D4
MPSSCPRNSRAGDMDRGVRRAPAVCTLLFLGIGLQLNPWAAEVIGTSTKNTMEPTTPAPTSVLPEEPGNYTDQLLNFVQAVKSSSITAGLEEQSTVFPLSQDTKFPDSTEIITFTQTPILVVESTKIAEQQEPTTEFQESLFSDFTVSLVTISTHLPNSLQVIPPTITTKSEEMATGFLTSLLASPGPPEKITIYPANSVVDLEPTPTTVKETAMYSTYLSSEIPNLMGTITASLQNSLPALEPAITAGTLSSEAALSYEELTFTSLSAQPSTSLATSSVLYDSLMTNEALDANVLSTLFLEASGASQTEPISSSLESSFFMHTATAQSTFISELGFLHLTEMDVSTGTLLMSTTYAEVPTSISFSWNSLVEMSLLNSQQSNVPFFHITTQDTTVVYSTPMATLLDVSVTLQSNSVTELVTKSNDITSITTKSPLQSIFFSSVGLPTEPHSTTSPDFSQIITQFSSTLMVYGITSSDLPEFSRSHLVTEEGVFTMVLSPVPPLTPLQTQTVLQSNAVTSELKDFEWMSGDYFETISMSSGYIKLSAQNTVTSDTEVPSSVFFGTVVPGSSVSPLSTWHMDSLNSSMYVANHVGSSLTEAILSTSIPFLSLEMETHVSSVLDSTMFMLSPTEQLFTATASIFVDQTLGTSVVIPVSTPFLGTSLFEPINTVEAPAFVPTESGQFFSRTIFSSEDSLYTSGISSSHLSMDFTLEPSSSLFSLHENVITSFTFWESSELSEPLSQGLTSMLETSKLFLVSSVFESEFTPATESINFEGSGLMPWQTSNINSVASLTPFSSEWKYESYTVSSEYSVLVEATSVLPLEPGTFYTSNVTDATSPLMPLFSLYLTTDYIPASLTSSISFNHTSSALIEETLQTSLFITPMPELSNTIASSLNVLTLSVNMFNTIGSSMPPTLSVSLTSLTPSLNVPLSLSVQSTVYLQPSSSSFVYSSTSVLVTSVVTSFLPTLPTKSTAKANNTATTISTTVSTASSINPPTATISSTPHVPITPPSGITGVTSFTMTRPTLLCDITNPEPYLVTAVLRGANVEGLLESIKDLMTLQFNRSVELEVYSPYPKLSFIVTSGPFVYTSFAVGNTLSTSHLLIGETSPILSLQTATLGLDQRFHIQTVLQFVPQTVDIRLCTFSEQIQRGLSLALYEVRRWRQETDNLTVQIVNITSSLSRGLIWKAPVTVSYAVKERSGFLNGSDVSDQLRNLSLVEFSFFLGFPVKQIAEPSRYPQLNVSPLLKDSWLKTVLLGVLEQQLRDEAFQAEMERKLAQLISEATGQKRRWKRASLAGVNTVQVVNVSRMDGSDDPVQLVYFIEDQYGDRLSAAKASDLINEVDIQRAAIIMGYRLQGVVAQPLNQVPESDRQAQNLWIIVGVAVPVLVVTVIIVILYWKLCRTDKLDFQPDTMSNLQQRQKLQAPNVKGFDFAKQHLGQHNKEDILVVHEPPPPVLHGPLKDSTPSENGDVPTPKSKGSSKHLKGRRHRGSRITPSDAGSSASEPSSGKESAEEGSHRPSAPPRETNPRLTVKEMPILGSGTEQHSSASIFEHVDRMSRSSEASRRFPSKIQLIAMQPIAAPPLHGLSMSEREAEANKINREIQTTLRHKSEIEHHRNKIRLRAKRKGHYEFPLVDVVAMTDTKERQRMYRKAQMQFDKILDPITGVPTVFIEPRKSSRARRSPKQRRRQQGSGSPPGADRDRLITTDSDGTYKRPPGVSNSAYVSDPDLPSDNPTPVSDLGKFPGSPHRPPPAQYVAPQPSIEEVRQTMQSLLDDAFALVAPSSQISGTPGVTQTGGTSGQQPVSSTPARTGRSFAPWGSPYPAHQASHFNRYVDYNVTQPSAPSLLTRSPGFGSGFLPPAEAIPSDSQQADTQYPARGMYPEEVPSVARPRPLGSTAGSAQIHQLTQVGIASRMGAQTSEPQNRVGQQPSTGPGWSSYYHQEEENTRNVTHRDPSHSHGPQDYGAPQMFSVNRGPVRQPLPTSHLPPPICYPSGSAEDLHPSHSSASLIKAIREELLRLSQKQASVTTYHS